MWQGVRTFLGGVVEDRLWHEMLKLNGQLRPHQRRKLRQMIHRASEFAAAGEGHRALMQLRACLLLSVKGVRDADAVQTVEALLTLLPQTKFQEPDLQPGAATPVPELDEELAHRFNVTHPQYLELPLGRRQALLQTLRYGVAHPPVTCPISWETLMDAPSGHLLDDVVAVFEDEYIAPSRPEARRLPPLLSVDDAGSTVVMEGAAESDDEDDQSVRQRRQGLRSYRFATSLMDAVVEGSVRNVSRALALIQSIPRHVRSPPSGRTPTAVPVEVRGRRVAVAMEVPTDEIPKLPTEQEEATIPRRRSICCISPNPDTGPAVSAPSPSRVLHPAGSKKRAGTMPPPRHRGMVVTKVLIRCHLFRGESLKEWFDLGHFSNPVTRTAVDPDDWCRLTAPRRTVVSQQQPSRG